MKSFTILLVIAFIWRSTVAQNGYCYNNDTERAQKLHFASKTSYQLVKGMELNKLANVPNCKPVKIWLLSRHGTRLPELDVIQNLGLLEPRRAEIIKNYADGKTFEGGLCAEDLTLLRNWVLDKNITGDHEQFLVDQGWRDLLTLATDYQAIFPNILTKPYDSKKYYFRHSNYQRTEASYKAFTEGLFGPNAYNNITLDPIPANDTLLDPQNVCELFMQQTKESKIPGTEVAIFKNSDLMNQTLASISKRLGYNTTLDYDSVSIMYEMCRFEQAWFLDKPSVWCTAFTMKEVEVFEYFEDLKHQDKAGYKGKLNPNMPCEVIQDMMKRLENDSDPQATIYISHSTLNLLILVALGAYKDDARMASDNFDQMSTRKWRTSVFDPFSANIAVVKYSCSANNETATNKLKFFLNQKELELDWCKDGLCDFDEVKNKYKRYYTADCSKLYCSTDSGYMIKGSILVLAATVVYNLFV